MICSTVEIYKKKQNGEKNLKEDKHESTLNYMSMLPKNIEQSLD